MSVPVNPPVNSVIFPDGTQILTKFISSVQAVAAVVNVGIGGVISAYSFTASDPAVANSIVTQIFSSLNGATSGPVVLVDSGIALHWTSATPNTNTAGSPYGPVVFVGTGFSQFTTLPNYDFQIYATDGPDIYFLNIRPSATLTIDSDIQITCAGTGDNPTDGTTTGTFTFYYSTDGGVTWTTTGLTLTVT